MAEQKKPEYVVNWGAVGTIALLSFSVAAILVGGSWLGQHRREAATRATPTKHASGQIRARLDALEPPTPTASDLELLPTHVESRARREPLDELDLEPPDLEPTTLPVQQRPAWQSDEMIRKVHLQPRPSWPRPVKFPERCETDPPPNRAVALYEELASQTRELDIHPGKVSWHDEFSPPLQSLHSKLIELQTDAEATAAKPPAVPGWHGLLALLNKRDDLRGFPLRKDNQCTLSTAEAAALCRISARLQRAKEQDDAAFAAADKFYHPYPVSRPLHSAIEHLQGGQLDSAIPGLVQILQVENQKIRLKLVEALARSKQAAATSALAQRALFDLSQDVRALAVASLKPRDISEFRSDLLAGFRYPWPPVAEHAADAMTRLQDRQAIPELVRLLDAPDPTSPFTNQQGETVVRELVRVNHLRNCYLCHLPSEAGAGRVRGLAPTPGEAFPPAYYRQQVGSSFVRADVTFLKQDFSLLHRMTRTWKDWPEYQRYDYFVRTRPLTASERDKLKDASPATQNYPQREAVLRTLRELTSIDAGITSAAWRKRFGLDMKAD